MKNMKEFRSSLCKKSNLSCVKLKVNNRKIEEKMYQKEFKSKVNTNVSMCFD